MSDEQGRYVEEVWKLLVTGRHGPAITILKEYWEDAMSAIEIWFGEGRTPQEAADFVVECLDIIEIES